MNVTYDTYYKESGNGPGRKAKYSDDRSRISENIKKDQNGCWLWSLSKTWDGYGQVGVYGGKKEKAHRLAYREFVGQIPSGQSVLHRCDVRMCCNPEHLFLGDQAENMRDMTAKGRRVAVGMKGEAHHKASVSDNDAKRIRSIPFSYGCVKNIAQTFGLSERQVKSIRSKRNWRHV